MAHLVEARSVTKTYGPANERVTVFRDLNFAIEAASTTALRGRSGSGKTTLLNLLGGLDRPDAGEVLFDSVNLSSIRGAKLARFRASKIGFIFQRFHLFMDMTVLENVLIPLRIAGGTGHKVLATALALVDAVGLSDKLACLPSALSAGQMQRVAIARALANNPRLIIADELTGNLDPETAASILDLLTRLRRQHGLALLIATHDPVIAAMCDRVFEVGSQGVLQSC